MDALVFASWTIYNRQEHYYCNTLFSNYGHNSKKPLEGIVIQTAMRILTVLNYLTHSLTHKSKHSHDSKKRLRRKLLHEHLCEVLHTYMNAHRICILCSSEILRTHINKRHSPDATNCEKGFLQAVQEQLLLDLIYNVLHFSF